MTDTERAKRLHELLYSCESRDEMCERLVELEEESAKLAIMLNVEHIARLNIERENAKLRELVADMWRFTGNACKKYPRLFDPSAQGGQTVQLNVIDAFEQRMRELGIEVDG